MFLLSRLCKEVTQVARQIEKSHGAYRYHRLGLAYITQKSIRSNLENKRAAMGRKNFVHGFSRTPE